MNNYLSVINYSSSNEDSLSEIKALGIKNSDRVLCITGSGARPLDLLITGPKEIVAIDYNPCQNHLLELKLAALCNLSYGDFLKFVGIRQAGGRRSIYCGIKHALTKQARDFWDRHSAVIENGIIYQGRWEKYFNTLAQILRIWRARRLKRLFACHGLDDQSRYWRAAWDDIPWRLFIGLITSRITWRSFMGDPGFYQYVPAVFSIPEYILTRFRIAADNCLFSASPFAKLLFLGHYNAQGPLPLYLQEKYFSLIRSRISCIRIVSASLIEYLRACTSARFDAFSLSDIASYTDPGDYESVWREVVRTAAPGARICERQFLVKREVPSSIAPCLVRNTTLEEELGLHDDSIFYTFVVTRVRND